VTGKAWKHGDQSFTDTKARSSSSQRTLPSYCC